MKKILFVCVHNSGRSQMAEAFFNQLAEDKSVALSAGTEPGAGVNPTVVKVMQEAGIDLSRNIPKALTQDMLDEAYKVISMGCGVEVACPATYIKTEDWGLQDPKGQPIEKVREIRDEIRRMVDHLLQSLESK